MAQAKQLLQDVEALAHRARRGIGAEVAGRPAPGAAMEAQARKVVLRRQLDVGIGFVVAQHHVVGRALLLDQALLQQQRLGFAVGDGAVDVGHLGGQRQGLSVQAAGAEVAGDAPSQIARLADVKRLAGLVEHAIDAGLLAEAGKLEAGGEGMGDGRHGRQYNPNPLPRGAIGSGCGAAKLLGADRFSQCRRNRWPPAESGRSAPPGGSAPHRWKRRVFQISDICSCSRSSAKDADSRICR